MSQRHQPVPILTADDPPSTRPDPVDVLLEIRDELRALNAALRPRRCRPSVEAFLSLFLSAVAGTLGSQVFRVRELLADPTFQQLANNLTPTQLGNVLSRSASDGDAHAGYTVEALHTQGGARFWRVVASHEVL